MAFIAGKTLQIAGMLGVAYGFILGVMLDGGLSDELLHLAVGFVVFSLGTFLVKRSDPSR